jgi:hypothetical protein
MKLSLRTRLVGAVVGAVILIFICSLIAARIVLEHDLVALGTTEITSDASAFSGYVASRREQIRLLVAQEAASATVLRDVQNRDATSLSGELGNVANTSGLSFLTVADATGHVLARSHAPAGGTIVSAPLFNAALVGGPVSTATLLPQAMLQMEQLPLPAVEAPQGLALVAAAPIIDRQQRTVGVLYGGVLLNHSYDLVDDASRAIGGAAALLDGDTIVSSSISTPDGIRVVDVHVPAATDVLRTGQPYIGADSEGGVTYLVRIDPVTDRNNHIVGAQWYGVPMAQLTGIVNHTTWTLLLWGLVAVIIVSALAIPLIQSLSKTLVEHSRKIREIAKEIGVLIVGAEVSGDHVSATKHAVERSGELIDAMARSEHPPDGVRELQTLNAELSGDVTVIETLTTEISTRMHQAVDRVAEMNAVAGGLNELVSGERGG